MSIPLSRSSKVLGLSFIFSANALLIAQGNSQSDRVRALNGQVLRLQNLSQSAPVSQQPTLARDAGPLLDRRLAALSALIEEDPEQALSLAFPANVLGDLAAAFPQFKTKLESRGSWQGAVRYSIIDGLKFAQSKSILEIGVGSQRVSVHFPGPIPKLKSGDLLSVSGVRAGNRVAVENAQIAATESWAECSPLGAQNIAVILVNLKNYQLPAEMTPNLVTGIILGNSGGGVQNTPDWSVDDFWQQNSDGQTWVNRAGAGALNVVGPYNLDGDYNAGGVCQYDDLRAAAYNAADNDLNYQDYTRAVIVFPPNDACGWAGLGTIGCWGGWECPGDGACNYSWALQRSDQMANRAWGVELSTHELGHNLTMAHSNARDFGTEPLGPIGATGALTEYGDRFATMGSWNFGFYNADASMNVLGWLAPGLQYLDVSTSGSYSLQWYGSRPAGLKALRIRRGAAKDNASLIVELRRNLGLYDSQLSAQVWSGALIHYRDDITGSASHLLDFTKTDTFSDPALTAGQTWNDPYSNLSLRVDSIVNDTLNLTVSYGSAPCTRANPKVTVSPSNPSTQAGSSVSYTVTVKNNDSAGCPAGTFDLNSTLPNGWPTGIFTEQALTIAPGASATTQLSKTPPWGTSVGTYTVNVTAANAAAGRSSSAKASCTVTAPPAPLTASAVVPGTSYRRNNTVPVTVTVKKGSSSVGGASVNFVLVGPDGQKTTAKTLTTGSNGKATWNYKVTAKGSYSVSAVATKGTQNVATTPDTFTVN